MREFSGGRLSLARGVMAVSFRGYGVNLTNIKRHYSTTPEQGALEKKADSGLTKFKRGISGWIPTGLEVKQEVKKKGIGFAITILIGFLTGAITISGISEWWENFLTDKNTKATNKEEFYVPPTTLEELENNYLQQNIELIKRQLLELNNIHPGLINPEELAYDEKKGKLTVFYNFNINGKVRKYRHYYYWKSHQDIETLEKAINVDLAFKELFSAFPSLIVKTNYPSNSLKIGNSIPRWKVLFIDVILKNMNLSDFWDEKTHTINIRKLKHCVDIVNKSYLPGEMWTPNLRVVLPVFKSECVIERDDIIDLISGRSWQPSGPVKLSDLMLVRVAHWNFDGEIRSGELIVHREIADEVIEIFGELFKKNYKISSIRLIDHYFQTGERYKDDVGNAIDERSMQDNNSSALYVRKKTNKEEWSHHSVGKAIDINPVQNPYIPYKDDQYLIPEHDKVAPRNAISSKLDKSIPEDQKGVLDMSTVEIFKKRGWQWGGFWTDPDRVRDYQHFSKLNRSDVVSTSSSPCANHH